VKVNEDQRTTTANLLNAFMGGLRWILDFEAVPTADSAVECSSTRYASSLRGGGQKAEFTSADPAKSWDTMADRKHCLLGGTMETSTRGDVTLLLGKMGKGDEAAAAKLISLVYGELRRLAGAYMRRERSDHTLQPTALVHEAYLKLVEQRSVDWQSRAHFFGIAAQMMRRILIDHARGHLRDKRGGGAIPVPLDEALVFAPEQASELVRLDESLERLAKIDPRQGKIVELRFFGGLTVEQTAEVMGISPKTVKRDWSMAKAWLHGDLQTSGN
jgi:RNA polymerase sigma-70 factor, ECF subfamily